MLINMYFLIQKLSTHCNHFSTYYYDHCYIHMNIYIYIFIGIWWGEEQIRIYMRLSYSSTHFLWSHVYIHLNHSNSAPKGPSRKPEWERFDCRFSSHCCFVLKTIQNFELDHNNLMIFTWTSDSNTLILRWMLTSPILSLIVLNCRNGFFFSKNRKNVPNERETN